MRGPLLFFCFQSPTIHTDKRTRLTATEAQLGTGMAGRRIERLKERVPCVFSHFRSRKKKEEKNTVIPLPHVTSISVVLPVHHHSGGHERQTHAHEKPSSSSEHGQRRNEDEHQGISPPGFLELFLLEYSQTKVSVSFNNQYQHPST